MDEMESAARRASADIMYRTGRCACGAVTLRALTSRAFGVCHCRMCRRWVGGVWMGVHSREKPEIDGPLRLWRSSHWAVRASCAECGSAIFHKLRLQRKRYTLGLGLFDDQSGWCLARQIFIDEKPDHYNLQEDGMRLTGAETLCAFVTGRMPS